MPEPPPPRRRKSMFRPVWFAFAPALGSPPVLCCLGAWGIRLLDGPREEPSLVRHFSRHRAEFDDFIAHYRGLEMNSAYRCPKCFDIGGLGYECGHYPRMTMEEDCVLLDWRWGSPQSCDEYLIHSPRGLAGIPTKYREPDRPQQFRITPIDDTWFYMLES